MTLRRISGRSQKAVGRRTTIESSASERSSKEASSSGLGKKRSPKLLRTFQKARKIVRRAKRVLVHKLASKKKKSTGSSITDRKSGRVFKASKKIARSLATFHEPPVEASASESPQSSIAETKKSEVDSTTACPAPAEPKSGIGVGSEMEPANALEIQDESLSAAEVQSNDLCAETDHIEALEMTQQEPSFSTSTEIVEETIEPVETPVEPEIDRLAQPEPEPEPAQTGDIESTTGIRFQCDCEDHDQTEGLGGLPFEPEKPVKTKVLLIDDDHSLGELLKIGLNLFGYDCVTAGNGKAAQEVLQTYRPDLILLDLFMPVMDGLVFLRWFRETAHDSTPVLVFSSLNDVNIAEEAFKSGVNSFIGKPLQMQKLVEAIKQLVPG